MANDDPVHVKCSSGDRSLQWLEGMQGSFERLVQGRTWCKGHARTPNKAPSSSLPPEFKGVATVATPLWSPSVSPPPRLAQAPSPLLGASPWVHLPLAHLPICSPQSSHSGLCRGKMGAPGPALCPVLASQNSFLVKSHMPPPRSQTRALPSPFASLPQLLFHDFLGPGFIS